MSSQYCLVLSTCPEGETAEALARWLVEDGLAACVNIVPDLTSVYRWQGTVETGRETLLLIKTETGLYPHLEQALRQRHPYELPEIIAVPIEHGLPDYLHWIRQCLSPPHQA